MEGGVERGGRDISVVLIVESGWRLVVVELLVCWGWDSGRRGHGGGRSCQREGGSLVEMQGQVDEGGEGEEVLHLVCLGCLGGLKKGGRRTGGIGLEG